MDTTDDELAEQLMARVAALLEDASATALIMSEHSLPDRIEHVRRAIRAAQVLVDAAATLTDDREAECSGRILPFGL